MTLPSCLRQTSISLILIVYENHNCMDITTMLKIRIKYMKTFYIMNVETSGLLKRYISNIIQLQLSYVQTLENCRPYLRYASNFMRLNFCKPMLTNHTKLNVHSISNKTYSSNINITGCMHELTTDPKSFHGLKVSFI